MCGLTVQVRNYSILVAGDFQLLSCRDFTGSYIRPLRATNALGPHIQREMVINSLLYNTLWDLQFYTPANLLPFHCLWIKAPSIGKSEKNKRRKWGQKMKGLRAFSFSAVWPHSHCLFFFLSRMFWQFPVPAVVSRKLMQHLCCWQTAGRSEPTKTAMYMYTVCWRTSHILTMGMSPLARGQDLHKEQKHYSLNHELNSIPSWFLETIFTTDFLHLCSSTLQLPLELFHLHWAWVQLWFQFNRNLIYEAYLGPLRVNNLVPFFFFLFLFLNEESLTPCKHISWSSGHLYAGLSWGL